MSAKWRAGTDVRVSINLNRKACIENYVVSTGADNKVSSKVNIVKPVIPAQLTDP